MHSEVAQCPVFSRLVCIALLSTAFAMGTSGCGGKEQIVTIPPFSAPVVDLVVNESYTLVVDLNVRPSMNVEVTASVESRFQDALRLSGTTLTYPRGQQSASLRVTANEATGGEFARVTFTVKDTGASQIWRVRVDEQSRARQ